MDNHINIQWEIYQNILKMCDNYREIEIKSERYTSEKEFDNNLLHSKYIFHHGTNRYGQLCIIVLVSKVSDIVSKTESMRNMIKSIYNEVFKSRNTKEEFEMIIVGENISKTIQKQIKGSDDLKTTLTIKETYSNAHMYLYEYNLFKVEVPKGPNCYPHIIMTREEKEEFFIRQRLVPHEIPKILVSDPQCIWKGAKKGDLIKIERRSPLAGIEIYYRYVK